MNNKKMSSGQITGVGCDVSNCKYNTIDCKCSASQIKVQNDKATTQVRNLLLDILSARLLRLILRGLCPYILF